MHRCSRFQRLRTIAVVVALFLAVHPFCRSQDDSEPTPAELEHAAGFFEKYLELTQGRLTLKGEVVDEHGQLLNGVSLEVEKSRLKNMGESSEQVTDRLSLDGTFDLAISGFFSVRLIFSKPGYFSRRAEFSMPGSGEVFAKITAGQVVEQQILTKDGLRVVLEKMGKLAALKMYNGFLECRVDGSAQMLDLDKSHVGTKALQIVQDVHDAAQLPPHSLYLLADRNADGTIQTEQTQRPRMNFVDVFPSRVTLKMSDPTGGFIVFAPPIRRHLYHQMKHAPENGYQRELILDANLLRQAQLAPGGELDARIHFFFKTGGRYGKGHIVGVVMEEDGTVRLRVALRVQTDGSRNVETDEGVLRRPHVAGHPVEP